VDAIGLVALTSTTGLQPPPVRCAMWAAVSSPSELTSPMPVTQTSLACCAIGPNASLESDDGSCRTRRGVRSRSKPVASEPIGIAVSITGETSPIAILSMTLRMFAIRQPKLPIRRSCC
jgi:hypothetical protein